jgi:hypothetical protein
MASVDCECSSDGDRSIEAMTANPPDAAARDVIRTTVDGFSDRDWWYRADQCVDTIIAALAAAGFHIRERRSEPVVEISVEGATEACDCVRILWESRGQHSPAGMRTEKALQELQSALARATGATE